MVDSPQNSFSASNLVDRSYGWCGCVVCRDRETFLSVSGNMSPVTYFSDSGVAGLHIFVR